MRLLVPPGQYGNDTRRRSRSSETRDANRAHDSSSQGTRQRRQLTPTQLRLGHRRIPGDETGGHQARPATQTERTRPSDSARGQNGADNHRRPPSQTRDADRAHPARRHRKSTCRPQAKEKARTFPTSTLRQHLCAGTFAKSDKAINIYIFKALQYEVNARGHIINHG
jgi:hypothetical protein